ncbi:hypothetical protein EVAR_75129_1 [Eumeta japonica]|uniref:Uncharacterized protein n=1 Tax=Eumeta variegata TaxID=151549 RepID=A0A4C1U1X7_EUMVA|nr:hypothetical protein EVAR_75129_1 [Eumeta japonica]
MHRVRVRNRASVGATVARRAYSPAPYLCMRIDATRLFGAEITLLSRASQDDGWLATVSDAPLPPYFIGGASVAHKCIGSLARGASTPLYWVQVRDGGLTVASCPGVFSSGIRPRRSCGCGSFYENPVRHLVLAGSASLNGRRRFRDFSRERSAARGPLVRRRDVPEEFMWA